MGYIRQRFVSDDPVECTCGCTVEAGSRYRAITIPMAKEVIEITTCDDDECMDRAILDAIDIYIDVEEHYLKTATDKEWDLEDGN